MHIHYQFFKAHAPYRFDFNDAYNHTPTNLNKSRINGNLPSKIFNENPTGSEFTHLFDNDNPTNLNTRIEKYAAKKTATEDFHTVN